MLKKPKVGQIVITKNPKCCHSGFPEGTWGKITRVTVDGYANKVTALNDWWIHCPSCLRRPRKGEKEPTSAL